MTRYQSYHRIRDRADVRTCALTRKRRTGEAMLAATGFFSTPQSTEAHLVCRRLVAAIPYGAKNEITGHFRSRRGRLRHRRPSRALCQSHKDMAPIHTRILEMGKKTMCCVAWLPLCSRLPARNSEIGQAGTSPEVRHREVEPFRLAQLDLDPLSFPVIVRARRVVLRRWCERAQRGNWNISCLKWGGMR
jgi:hypothetical protein